MDFLLSLKEQGADPAPLREMPMRKPEFAWLFEAYSLLTRSRQVGMSAFYIPMTEYAAYLDIIQMDDIEERTFLVSVVSQVDATLLSEQMAEQQKERQT